MNKIAACYHHVPETLRTFVHSCQLSLEGPVVMVIGYTTIGIGHRLFCEMCRCRQWTVTIEVRGWYVADVRRKHLAGPGDGSGQQHVGIHFSYRVSASSLAITTFDKYFSSTTIDNIADTISYCSSTTIDNIADTISYCSNTTMDNIIAALMLLLVIAAMLPSLILLW
jgi:hypothetical protein